MMFKSTSKRRCGVWMRYPLHILVLACGHSIRVSDLNSGKTCYRFRNYMASEEGSDTIGRVHHQRMISSENLTLPKPTSPCRVLQHVQE
ncbi:hypothetical protein BJ322DRAFT_1068089 [Thelephora terrestris]|uniref:Uncharacterized protein n=1 Tax=Thelephora terrestris TaxID=56493 RepID=A0A9P6L5V7_9AGAM|nr:hypothetical protein BJ322DRAFT_1068089 [Thelephora terrestris]